MKALIGRGVIGSVLQKSIDFDHVYDSKNIKDIVNYQYDIVYCAAPSGNRLTANADPGHDKSNINRLIEVLQSVVSKNFVLISTVDTQVKDTAYAKNRAELEQFVLAMPNSRIIRLCSLIGTEIKKNVLYDLAHNQYISGINLYDTCQWYPLNNLVHDISRTNDQVMNFVSEPIENSSIIKKFYPQYLEQVKTEKHNTYNLQPYMYTVADIMEQMRQYCDKNSQ